MKKVTIASLILLSMMFVGFAHAEENEPTDDSNTKPWYEFRKERQEEREQNREEMQEERKEQREEMKEVREEHRETMRERFDEFKKARIDNLLGLMKRRFSWAIERLENIADRIESRIAKMEAEHDVDLDEASNHLAEGRKHIDAAQEALDDISTSTDDIVDEESNSSGFSSIRDAFADVKTEIKAAWDELHQAIELIKAGRPDDKDEDGDDDDSDDSDDDNS